VSEQVLATGLRSAEWKTEKLVVFLLFPIVYCLVLKGLRISLKWSRGSSVSIVFRQQTEKPRDFISISGMGKRLFIFYRNSRLPLEPAKLPNQWVLGSVTWGAAREADNINST
jgi:hypothetical protein